ncbi:hypothetical protein M419DRAFT_10284 [Trichoderma reesei RUT C-30]|jgi:hypothetical protein|uniref:Uncharacterized protein n=1 Tax=Hypocrea jecorina (strain ATCC 56765 / BCRC 32924 / NRRL 11460 / Rut C-30) TaxID=1344414 RepID=A0A024S4H3_HYPJR|nr:hypothetical protein M419DRAFT_10284 [Trichoderma reesei RUT C-30]
MPDSDIHQGLGAFGTLIQQLMFMLTMFSAATATVVTASEQPSPPRSKFPEAGSESGARGSAAVLSTTYLCMPLLCGMRPQAVGCNPAHGGCPTTRTLGFKESYTNRPQS